MVYVLSGIFAAIGGIMLLSRLTYADPNAGSGYEMNAMLPRLSDESLYQAERGRSETHWWEPLFSVL